MSEDEPGFWGGPIRFVVLGDGQLLWGSDPISERHKLQPFKLDVSNVKVLELRAYVPSGSITGAHAAWVDPYVTVK
jgi:hypothetical protein